MVAYAFFYFLTTGFRGAGIHRNFGGGEKGDSASGTLRNYATKRSALWRYAERLESVSLECLDAFDCIKKYDHAQTLFYIDPPYDCKSSTEYATVWGDAESKRLVDALLELKGTFVLTVYDTPEYSRLLVDPDVCKRDIVKTTTVSPRFKKRRTRRDRLL